MLELFYWTTPNGHKITIFLEETGLPYKITPIDIGKGDQFGERFLKHSPNNRIPAIIDTNPADGSESVSVFESGAILQYLAEKTGQFLPTELHARYEVLQWLNWQMGGLGPMAGQNHHFSVYAPERIPYATERYVKETSRLYAVLDKQLAEREYIAGEYSIADMACYPWVVPYERQQQDINAFPHLKRWFDRMAQRPAVIKAYELAKQIVPEAKPFSEEEKKMLFGQGADRVK
ncbi:glutathione binding-like protein [Gynuella sp.]|uniref:glutathione binding-like protein n=1 Tax=Gynuella sp. TaxID=2969146 RepID=UPI003D0CBEFC